MAGLSNLSSNPVQASHDPTDLTSGVDLDRMHKSQRARILIIDDDVDLIDLLKITLRQAGFDVASASNAQSALSQVVEVNPDAILLDLMMPEMDGWSLYQHLRTITRAPVIVISASANQEYAVRSLEMGAQDYMTKPIYNPEMIARINKVLQRVKKEESRVGAVFPEIELSLDSESHEITLRGQTIYLPPSEFNFLKILAEAAPKCVSCAVIAGRLWGEDSSQHRSHIKNIVFLLRQKMEEDPSLPQLIVNYRGLGYQLDTRTGGHANRKSSR
jgi:DNA-binding response OmpR family regulator